MSFDQTSAKMIALQYTSNQGDESGLAESFAHICWFLYENVDRLSQLRFKPTLIFTTQGLHYLAKRYFDEYRRPSIPPQKPQTIPDPIVGTVMMEFYNYSQSDVERIKTEHQQAMSAENCVGALLERYLDTVLRPQEWHWCCGSFVRAIDFVKHDQNGTWMALQIKNRDNSENSSSSAIRQGTTIQKWFRSFSRTGKTNWANLPPIMQGYGLSEESFNDFVRKYIRNAKQGTNSQS
jgi:hypothetical protein